MTFTKKISVAWVLTIRVMISIQLISGLRILGLFPLQVKSHFMMCEELMRGLAAKGHHVDVYSHFPLESPIKNYQDYSLKGLIPPLINDISFDTLMKTPHHEARLKLWFETLQEPLCDLIGSAPFQKLLHDPPTDPPYDLIITELSIVYCYIPFGPHLRLPIIGVVTTPLADYQYNGFGASKNLAVDRSMFSPYSVSRSFISRLDNFLNYEIAVRHFNKYTSPQSKYIEKYFGPGFPSIIDLPKYVSLVLVNHDISFHGTEQFVPKVVPVGGLHIVDRNQSLEEVVQRWLDESVAGCIYFTFGSMIRIETFPKDILHVFYKAFENIKPVRVLLKVVNPEELPYGLPSNVLIRSWFQSIPILKHKNLKAVITHGGLMGIQEAIYYGVPMVGMPLVNDQYFNVIACVARKIAVRVEFYGITEESFTHALNEILTNSIYRMSIERVSKQFRDHPLTPLDTAIFWIEYIYRHGKDVLKSPIEDMPWWQTSLLDVYSFLTAFMILVLYCIIRLLKLMKSLCSRRPSRNANIKKKEI